MTIAKQTERPMKDAFPFIYIGQGPGRPTYYELYLDIVFEDTPDAQQKAGIEGRVPKYLLEALCWNAELLSLQNAEIGHHVKEELEADWTDGLSLDEAFDKDSELWLSPKKDSWDRFNQQLDRWVLTLHQYAPIAFAIKYFEVPKKRYTAWHRWSAARAPGPILDYVERSSADVWHRPLIDYFRVVSPKKVEVATKQRVVEFLLRQEPLEASSVLAVFLAGCTKSDQEQVFHQAIANENTAILFALCEGSKSVEVFLDDDARVQALVPLVEAMIAGDDHETVYCQVYQRALKLVEVNCGIDEGRYLPALLKKRIGQAARICEVLMLALPGSHAPTIERAAMYADMLWWGVYITGSSLFAILGDEEKALRYASVGLDHFAGHVNEKRYREQGAQYGRASGSEVLAEVHRSNES